jgi:predicted signal transduction protein with EAL and GGDEF domain
LSTTTEPSRPAFVAQLADRLLERAADDHRAGLLVALEGVDVDGSGRVQQRDAAARDDALLERRAGRLDGVLDAVLLLLHLRLGRSADLDDRDTAGELGEPLLELLAVEVGVGVLDSRP